MKEEDIVTIDEALYGFRNAQYDASARRLLSKKRILAHILKLAVDEFKEVSVKDIAEIYIEGEPDVNQTPVDKDETNLAHEEIHGLHNEDTSPSEGKVVFDILFYAKAPKTDELITLIINIEAQRTYRTSYPLMKRAVYYASRLISSQKMIEFTGSDYGNLRKVYSIWLCMDGPQKRNSINTYTLNERQVFSTYKEQLENYDFIHIVMVYLGRHKTRNRLLELLRILFKSDLSVKAKEEQLKDNYDISLTPDMESEMNTMCNLSLGIAVHSIRIQMN